MAATMLLQLRALVASCFFGSAPAPVPALENDDILWEILTHLSPLPSSLLRASLVCKRWHGILSDPAFLRRFRTHHRRPPLLGFFHTRTFTPLLRAPDRISPERFSVPQPRHGFLFVCCVRHGLALFLNQKLLEAVVWDPITGFQQTIPYAPKFTVHGVDGHGAVLRTTPAAADGGDGSVCFKVVLMCIKERSGDGDTRSVFIAIYESATQKWSKTSSTVIPYDYYSFIPNILVGNALCGFLHWSTGILKFDLGTKTVGVIQTPKRTHTGNSAFSRVVRTEDGGLGLAKLDATGIKLWGRTNDGAAAAGWVLQKTFDLDKLVFPLLPRTDAANHSNYFPRIVGYDEDNNVIHVAVNNSVFTVNLETLHYTKILDDGRSIHWYYPYTRFYALGSRRCPAALHAKIKK